MSSTESNLPGSFIPIPRPPKGTPAGTLTGTGDVGVGSAEGIFSRERGFVGGLTRGFLTAMRDLCTVKLSTGASTCNDKNV